MTRNRDDLFDGQPAPADHDCVVACLPGGRYAVSQIMFGHPGLPWGRAQKSKKLNH